MSNPTFSGSNASLVKNHNLRAILLTFLHTGQVSRAHLAKSTALSSTTITNIVGELLDQGIVAEEGAESYKGRRSVGRPRTSLRLIPNARFAVGIHIGIGTLRAAVTNLNAEVIENAITAYDIQLPANGVLELIAGLVEDTVARSGVDRKRLIGLGVGASGLVNYQTGTNVLAPTLGWHNVPVRDWLEARLKMAVCVDNNVRAMALGEALFGAGRGVNSLAFVYGRVGVGAGFVVNGQLFRGSGAGAGEIGHTVMIPDGGELCHCGKHGCLETLVSEPVLVNEAERIAREHPDSIIAAKLAQTGEAKPIERVFDAARSGDTRTRTLIEERARYLGIALANLVNVLNPELILLGGMFAEGQELFAPVTEATMRQTAFAGLGERVRLQTTNFGWRAGVIGAAALALTTFFYEQSEPV
jgi:glucokinase-like ROK family protein